MTRCPRCQFVECLCDVIPTIKTRTRVVIVRHHLERYRSSNTGRLAALALANSTIVDHGAGNVVQASAIPRAHAWLVYPEGPIATTPPSPPPATLVIIDAGWHQSRRMRQRLAPLRGLPVLHVAASSAAPRMRAAPGPGRVSTIEAIAAALRLVESETAAVALEDLFAVAVDRMARSRNSGAADDEPADTDPDD